MRKVREIYGQYKIMPSLQMHQLRVAAVGKLVCDNLRSNINVEDVILECLFHDMGNIIKSDLAYFPDFVQPEGREYWESVKADFIQRYGTEQHAANAAIGREIGLPTNVIEMMNSSGFSKVRDVLGHGSEELKVCQYADMRVGPHGVLSMDERLKEGGERYQKKMDKFDVISEETKPDEDFKNLLDAAASLEKYIFVNATINPEQITDEKVAPIIEDLWEYKVTTIF